MTAHLVLSQLSFRQAAGDPPVTHMPRISLFPHTRITLIVRSETGAISYIEDVGITFRNFPEEKRVREKLVRDAKERFGADADISTNTRDVC
jgi:hypothetical protein